MEKSEPNLVPEWLRSSSGCGVGGGSSGHHFASQQGGALITYSYICISLHIIVYVMYVVN